MLTGQGGTVLIGGEAGIGKTTLVEDLSIQAEEFGCLVLWGHCYDLTVTPPYGPWVELARSYQPVEDLPSFPSFLRDPEALAGVGSQASLFAQTWEFFAAVASHRPMLLILEDLHWADADSLSLLRFTARQLAQQRVLLVVTYRSDELTRRHPLYQLIPLLVREVDAQRLGVRPLDDTGQRQLIEMRYRLSATDTDRLEAHLLAHAEGNPLYAGELLRSLEETGVLADNDGEWELGDLEQVRIPPLLMQVIEGRLGRLSDPTRELLAMAAVIGQEVPLDIWQRVSRVDDDELVSAIEQGQAAQLLEEVVGGTTYRFRHALIREALYQEVVALRRRLWHRQVGEALAETRSPDPDAVASHYQQAGDPRAVDWLIRAGERAESVYALRTAAERDEVAAELLQGAPERSRERAALLYRTARNLRFADIELSISFLRKAIDVASDAGDDAQQALMRWDLGLHQCNAGHYREGISEMRKADALLAGSPSADAVDLERAELAGLDLKLGTLVIMLAHAGRYVEVGDDGERYLQQIRTRVDMVKLLEYAAGGWTAWADACFGMALAYSALGEPERAAELLGTARQGYRADRHHALESLLLSHWLQEVICPYRTDDLAERSCVAEDAEAAAARAGGAVRPDSSPDSAILPVLLIEGRWDDALAVAMPELNGIGLFKEVAQRTIATIAWRQGQAELAWAQIHDVLPEGPGTDPGDTLFFNAVALQRIACHLSLAAGKRAEARQWIEAHDHWIAWSGADLGHADGQFLWAEYQHADGDVALARQRGEQALAHASDPRQPLALIAIHRFLGELDTDERRFAEAEDHLQESLSLADACLAPFERALTLLATAELRVAQKQPDDARELLGEVRTICEPLGAKPTLERVTALENRLGLPPKVVHPAGLSAQEVEVLRLIAQGLTDVQAAEQLFLSPRTIGSHLATIYSKLGVSSRAAATRFAVEHGLV